MTRPMWPALFDALAGVTTVRAAVVEEKRALTHLDTLVATLLRGVTRCTNLQALRAQICSKQPCVKPASEVESTRHRRSFARRPGARNASGAPAQKTDTMNPNTPCRLIQAPRTLR